jgi:hypothetical protein
MYGHLDLTMHRCSFLFSPWYAVTSISDLSQLHLYEHKMDSILERRFPELHSEWTGVVDRVHISLLVVDDAPREDFSPRQRHTLKEFAVRIFIL